MARERLVALARRPTGVNRDRTCGTWPRKVVRVPSSPAPLADTANVRVKVRTSNTLGKSRAIDAQKEYRFCREKTSRSRYERNQRAHSVQDSGGGIAAVDQGFQAHRETRKGLSHASPT